LIQIPSGFAINTETMELTFFSSNPFFRPMGNKIERYL
jgi:hypothetical protein